MKIKNIKAKIIELKDRTIKLKLYIDKDIADELTVEFNQESEQVIKSVIFIKSR